MDFIGIIAIAVGLGADAMSVSAAVGVKWNAAGHKLRLALSMGFFQFFMPILGWLLGRELAGPMQHFGKYLAAGLVFVIGLKMLIEVIHNKPGESAEAAEHAVEKALHLKSKDPTQGWSLIGLSLATSIDALAVGVSLALKGASGGYSIWMVSVIIGITAAIMSLLGVLLGKHIGKAIGRPAELIGALVLMVLGVTFLWA